MENAHDSAQPTPPPRSEGPACSGIPPKPRARRITCKVCWVLSLAWAIGWPLGVSTLGVWRGRGDQADLAWATTWYPIAMLWLAYWLVACFFWVPWGAIWETATEAAPMPPESNEPVGTPTQAAELARG